MEGRRNCCFSASEPNLQGRSSRYPALETRRGGRWQVPGQRRGGHVRLDPDGHGDASAADVAQLLRHGHAVAEVQTQASVLCRSRNPPLLL